MKRRSSIIVIGCILATALAAIAAEKHGAGGHSMDHGVTSALSKSSEEQGKIDNSFKHRAVSEGIRAEFQVMTLASMNMKDPDGHTHHIMVNLFNENSGKPLKDAVGKIKIIRPSKKEDELELKDYNGILAANFTANEAGKYGIICLLKAGGKKPLYKFWYANHK